MACCRGCCVPIRLFAATASRLMLCSPAMAVPFSAWKPTGQRIRRSGVGRHGLSQQGLGRCGCRHSCSVRIAPELVAVFSAG